MIVNNNLLISIIILFHTRVHQTVDDLGDAEKIESHGPFPGKDFGRLYLGSGAYFWDDHIELAHWWGEKHIGEDYVICCADLKVDENTFCDLVGSRQDMLHLKNLITELNITHLKLGAIIEVLKKLEQKYRRGDIFPFKVIRAVDVSYSSYKQELYDFAEGKSGKTSLNPVYLICLIARSDIYLSSYRIIHPAKYVSGD